MLRSRHPHPPPHPSTDGTRVDDRWLGGEAGAGGGLKHECLLSSDFRSLAEAVDQLSTGSNQACRAISTGQLSTLLHLHLRPIDVVVFHGPQGDLVSGGASRLDAFSGYPVRT